MKMPIHVPTTLACCLMLMAMPWAMADAASYVPHEIIDQLGAENATHRQGTTLLLFYGVTAEAAHGLVGREFSVFREAGPACPPEQRHVGRVRIIRTSGNHQLEAVVMEGDVRDGDIAHLGGSYGLVVPARERCEAPTPTP